MFKAIITQFTKEWRDASRDKRTLLSVVAIIVGFPILYGSILGLTERRHSQDAQRTIRLAVDTCEYWQEFCDFLNWNGVEIHERPTNLSESLSQGELEASITIPENSLEMLSLGQNFSLILNFHQSLERSMQAVRRLEGLISRYQMSLSSRVLLSHGIAPGELSNFTLERQSITEDQLRQFLMGTLFLSIIVMIAFMATLQYANDSIAGEKERGTLELVLNMAVPRSSILAGKWLLLVLIVSFSAIFASLIYKLMGDLAIFQRVLGIYSTLTWPQVLAGLALFFPVFFLAPILQLLISTNARSLREAQTYSSILMFLAFIPVAFLDSFSEAKWMAVAPITGQALALRQFYRGSSVDINSLLIAEALTIAAVILAFYFTVGKMKSEAVLRSA